MIMKLISRKKCKAIHTIHDSIQFMIFMIYFATILKNIILIFLISYNIIFLFLNC